jgi:hypothetical protein
LIVTPVTVKTLHQRIIVFSPEHWEPTTAF